MVMKKNQDPLFTTPTAPIEMKNSCVAGGKARRKGDIVEVNEREFRYLVSKGHAIPHLGEAKIKAEPKTRKKRARKQ